MNELLNIASALNIDVNIITIIALMALGFCIKHIKFLSKISNNLIPIIILITSLAIGIIDKNADTTVVQAVLCSVINAAIAIGFHQYGKNFIPMIKSFFSGENVNVEEDEEESEEGNV